MSKLLVLQHDPKEGLGSFEEELKKQNISWETLMVSNQTIFPASTKLEEYSGFIILGGPVGVYEIDLHPWLRKELVIVEEMLRLKKPVLGICLGAQLLSKAAGHGGRAFRGPKPEMGWYPIQLDDWFYKRNPLFFQVDPTTPHMVFQWHRDTFDIPIDGYRLAWNENYINQAFCYNGNAIGIQFHVEMTEELIQEWLAGKGRDEAIAAGSDPDKIIADIPKYLPGMKDLSHKIIYGFATLLRDNRRKAA